MGEFTGGCRELCCSLCAVVGDFFFFCAPATAAETAEAELLYNVVEKLLGRSL